MACNRTLTAGPGGDDDDDDDEIHGFLLSPLRIHPIHLAAYGTTRINEETCPFKEVCQRGGWMGV